MAMRRSIGPPNRANLLPTVHRRHRLRLSQPAIAVVVVLRQVH